MNGDPGGVIRLRWFAEFAALERIGVRRRYRSYKVFAALARASLDLAAQKGYRLVAGRARGNTYKLWSRFAGHQSGPAIVTPRGTLFPTLFELPPRPGGQMGAGPFGDPMFEALVAQREGEWSFHGSPQQHVATQ